MNIVKKLKHIIQWLAPYGLVNNYYQAKKSKAGKTMNNSFMDEYKSYISKGEYVSLNEDSPFETIVSVQGFGFSGSGAVVDLLREYRDVKVVGYVDGDGSLTEANEDCEEVDILRLAGGLFEVERYLNSNNAFQNDALLHRLVNLLEKSSIYKCYPEIHKYFYELLRQICYVYVNESRKQFYNLHLDYHGHNDTLELKSMTIDDYRNICRKFLNSVLTVFKTNASIRFLVLDQFIMDGEYDVDRYKQYVPNLKALVVYRDPRDIFAYARLIHEDWIPNRDINEYIRWYQNSIKFFNVLEREQYYVVQFERLIEEYENQVMGIEQYLGLSSTSHIRMRQHFDPNVSMKNLQLYKNYPDLENQFVVIKNELQSLCYDRNM